MSRSYTPSVEALLRHPGTGGMYDGYRCTCTRTCPAACDGARGCEACTRAWFDAELDEIIGANWPSNSA